MILLMGLQKKPKTLKRLEQNEARNEMEEEVRVGEGFRQEKGDDDVNVFKGSRVHFEG